MKVLKSEKLKSPEWSIMMLALPAFLKKMLEKGNKCGIIL